jgi:FolB domain-containing protein
MTPGTIHIERLALETTLGVTDAERATPRPIWIDISMDVDIGPAAATDRLAETVDYTAVRDRVAAVVTGAAHHLLESLTLSVLDAVISDARVQRAGVRVTKPHAMRLADAVSVSVQWERRATSA